LSDDQIHNQEPKKKRYAKVLSTKFEEVIQGVISGFDRLLFHGSLRPCLTIYHYRIDSEFACMHTRIQTWFPFYSHVCISGGKVDDSTRFSELTPDLQQPCQYQGRRVRAPHLFQAA